MLVSLKTSCNAVVMVTLKVLRRGRHVKEKEGLRSVLLHPTNEMKLLV